MEGFYNSLSCGGGATGGLSILRCLVNCLPLASYLSAVSQNATYAECGLLGFGKMRAVLQFFRGHLFVCLYFVSNI